MQTAAAKQAVVLSPRVTLNARPLQPVRVSCALKCHVVSMKTLQITLMYSNTSSLHLSLTFTLMSLGKNDYLLFWIISIKLSDHHSEFASI